MMLEIKNISKVYDSSLVALDDVTLTIDKGLFGLIGPNGSGKSTLMRILSTLQTPTRGHVFFDGFDINKNKILLRENLGYLPQEFGVLPHLSAKQMMQHIAKLKGLRDKIKREERVNELLQITNLFDYKNAKVSSFSSGMKRRLGVALCLLNDPKLIIVDEPTAGLDASERINFLNILTDLSENKIVILSTHIIKDVQDYCDNIAIINKGKILFVGTQNDASKNIYDMLWERTFSKEEWRNRENEYQILSKSYKNNDVLIKVCSKLRYDGFRKAIPTLEDYYLLLTK